MTRKTQGVHDLAQLVLQSLAPPYREDVTEDLCLVIENRVDRFHNYLALSDELKHRIANNWIGQFTKAITGGQTVCEVEARRSKLITGYTKLSFAPQSSVSLPTQ